MERLLIEYNRYGNPIESNVRCRDCGGEVFDDITGILLFGSVARGHADGEVLTAAKLHSGRKTDLADALAAIPSTDLDMVETHLHRGDIDALREQLSDAQAFIKEGGLDHRLKSMFGQSSASAEDIETLPEFLKRQQM